MPKSPLIKHHLRLLFLLGVFCISLFMFNVGLIVADKLPEKSTKVGADKMLFVQEIESGEVKLVENDIYVLTVKNSHPRIVYFSESPLELVGSMPLSEYQRVWENYFSKQHPNGALIFETGAEKQTTTIVELQSATVNEILGMTTYTVKLLHIDDTKLMMMHRDASQVLPEKFEVASLFIDAYPTPVDGHTVK